MGPIRPELIGTFPGPVFGEGRAPPRAGDDPAKCLTIDGFDQMRGRT